MRSNSFSHQTRKGSSHQSAPPGDDTPRGVSPAARIAPANPLPPLTWSASFVAVVAPFAAFILAIVWLWGWGVTWSPLILLLALSVGTALGITIGFHRLFTHRSFQTTRPIQVCLAVLGSMAAEGPLLKWVAVHRLHHQRSDEAGDPHSPHLHKAGLGGLASGLWHAHIGWLFGPDAPGLAAYVPDLLADPLVCRLSRLFGVWVVAGLAIPAIAGGLLTMTWMGALQGFIWGGLVRIFLVHHMTWSINSICHLWGTRPFYTRDHSRNNPVFGVVGMGEGWHNNHHAFPTSARHGLRWWEIDVSYLVIRVLVLVGLAWKVHLPRPEAMASKRQQAGELRRRGDRAAQWGAAATPMT